jgi:hypothetical protein
MLISRLYLSLLQLSNVVLKRARHLGGAPRRDVLLKQLVHFLQGLARRLRVHEDRLDHHGDAECAKDHKGLPLDVLEGGWDEEGEGEVEATTQHTYQITVRGLRRSGGGTYIQLPEAARPTPLARYLRGKISLA